MPLPIVAQWFATRLWAVESAQEHLEDCFPAKSTSAKAAFCSQHRSTSSVGSEVQDGLLADLRSLRVDYALWRRQLRT
jgi:hypothetical protein